jgi:hypothetical protein
MNRVLAAALAVTVSSIGVVSAEPAAGGGAIVPSTRSRPRVTVRVYDGTRIDPRTRRDAVARTRRLLNSADLPAVFHDCSPDATASVKSCETPPLPGDLIIRMVRTPDGSTPRTRHVLGFATINAATGRGTMATVFTDRVVALSTLARVPLDTMLSRTIAHEIGHLLLGTNEHGSTGLMREVWTLDELADGKKEHWSFTAAELARLHGPA